MDNSQRDVGGVVPFEPYPLGPESLPAQGSPMVQGGVQAPLHIPPFPPLGDLVPQPRYGHKANSKTEYHREPPITFVVRGRSGMSLQDAIGGTYEGLVDRDEEMFVGCGRTAISLRIQVCARRQFSGTYCLITTPWLLHAVARMQTLDPPCTCKPC